MQLEIFTPFIEPGVMVAQKFGENAAYYQKQFGTNGHMGVDLFAQHGRPVYSPIDGIATYVTDSHGGDGIYVQTIDKRDWNGGTNKMMIILWHMCAKDDPQFPIQIKADGSWVPVKCGDLLGYADNTGAPYESSGDHLHMGLYPLDDLGQFLLPDNGFRGAVDPLPYFSKMTAVQYASVLNKIKLLTALIQDLLKRFFNK